MGVFTPSGATSPASEITVVTGDSVSTPTVSNVPLSLAGTEYSFTVPANSKRFMIRSRNSSTLNVSFNSGQTSINYLTVRPGVVYCESNLLASNTYTLYVKTATPSDVLEVVSWR